MKKRALENRQALGSPAKTTFMTWTAGCSLILSIIWGFTSINDKTKTYDILGSPFASSILPYLAIFSRIFVPALVKKDTLVLHDTFKSNTPRNKFRIYLLDYVGVGVGGGGDDTWLLHVMWRTTWATAGWVTEQAVEVTVTTWDTQQASVQAEITLCPLEPYFHSNAPVLLRPPLETWGNGATAGIKNIQISSLLCHRNDWEHKDPSLHFTRAMTMRAKSQNMKEFLPFI